MLLPKDTQLCLPKNGYLQQNIVNISLQVMTVYIFCLPMHIFYHMSQQFSNTGSEMKKLLK